MAKSSNPKGVGYYYREGELYCWRIKRNGRQIVRKAKTQKELEEKVKAVRGAGYVKSKTLVSEYFEDWLEDVKRLNGEATYAQYESIYRNHIKPVIGNLKVSTIKPSDIREVLSIMNTKVVERKNKDGEVVSRQVGLSEKTMKHARFIMKTVFTKAVEEDGLLEENPVTKKIRVPKKQEKRQKVLTIPELVAFFKEISNSRWVWSVWFNLVTGLRRGELLALMSDDIDWENRRIRINKSNTVFGPSGTKNRKEDYIYLTKIAVYFLDKQFEMLKREGNPVIFNEDGTMKSGYKGESFLVFPTEKGTMIKPNTYYHTIKRYAEKAGINAHPHCFRHTFTYFLRNKLSLKELQNALRHEASTSTLDIYGNLIDDTNDEMGEVMDDVFTKVESEVSKRIYNSEKKGNVISLEKWKKAR